uniref:Interferon-induced protein with tetratricopeptide repeats 5 n=1 Tax=Lygus hesperus TaxID=30085 RepID=A0A0K8T1G3_LYGHE
MTMEELLKKTECHFNWNISTIDVTDLNWVEKFREKIEENQSLDEPSELIWPLKLTYAFELLPTDKDESAKVVEEVIKEIEEARGGLTSKYRISYVHIAYSFKAFTLVKSQGYSAKVGNLLKHIKPVAEMTQVEKSAVLAMQAQVLRYYGPNGTYKCVPLQREAIRLNKEEIEFKLSLVVSMNRKRHYDISSLSKMTWSDIEEPVSILEELLNHPKLTSNQKVSCEYFLASAYADFLKTLKQFSPEYKECKLQILKSCDWIHDKSDHPQIMSFCADNFFYLEKNMPKGLRVIERALKKYPLHVGVNTKASKLYKATNNLKSAAKHAQVALDNGGFGAAWILLELKTKLREEFDDDEYFDKLLQFFPQRYEKQIHLSACLYYMQSKYDVVKGARHMEMALAQDPSYDSLKSCYSVWVARVINPLEMAYGKIVGALETTGHCREDLSTLRRVQDKIKEFADVDSFDLTSQTDPPGIKRGERTVAARTAAPNTIGADHRAPTAGFGHNRRDPVERPSVFNSRSATTSASNARDVSKLKKGSFFQWMSEDNQGATTNSRSTLNNREAASNCFSDFRTKGDWNRSSGSNSKLSCSRAPIVRGSASSLSISSPTGTNPNEDASNLKKANFLKRTNRAITGASTSTFNTRGTTSSNHSPNSFQTERQSARNM